MLFTHFPQTRRKTRAQSLALAPDAQCQNELTPVKQQSHSTSTDTPGQSCAHMSTAQVFASCSNCCAKASVSSSCAACSATRSAWLFNVLGPAARACNRSSALNTRASLKTTCQSLLLPWCHPGVGQLLTSMQSTAFADPQATVQLLGHPIQLCGGSQHQQLQAELGSPPRNYALSQITARVLTGRCHSPCTMSAAQASSCPSMPRDPLAACIIEQSQNRPTCKFPYTEVPAVFENSGGCPF